MRTLGAAERQLLERLLSVDFPGRHELLLQVETALVEPIDSEGSLRFVISSNVAAPVVRRIPIEAQCQDADGMWIHALLHVVKGRISELEFYKDDSSPIIRMPTRDEWELVVIN